MYEYTARLIKVVDGDTVDLSIDLGFKVSIQERFRLSRINAPEIKGETKERGDMATKYLQSTLDGQMLRVKTQKDRKEKYGRYLADIYMPDGSCVNDMIVHAGLAAYVDY